MFVNSQAGSVEDLDEQSHDIMNEFRQVGVDAVVTAVEPQQLADAMRDAWQPGIDAIVIAGGDGTVNCAAGVAAGSNIVLGVLPMGTFNHFAKDLGVPDDLAAAVKFLADAVIADVDVGEVNGRVFVNNASIGVYPTMVGDREAIRKRRGWGKVRAAPVAIVQTLRRLPVHALRVAIDGSASVAVTTPFLFVGNGMFDRHGERLGRRTSLTDHRLGVYVIATTSRWRLVVNAIKARLGGVDAATEMERRTGEAMVIESDETAIEIALDGEPTDLRVPLQFVSRRGALRVLGAVAEAPGSG